MQNVRTYSWKRLLDTSVAIPTLVVAAPFMLAITFLSAVTLGSPILFRQQRPGLNRHPFTILKFRTMSNKSDSHGNLLPDAGRITWFGRLLRRTSLDELPELFNVLRGEMSIVGPRPLLLQYLDRYSAFQMRRHEVRPGITGWAQINGRNAVSWEQKFSMDVWYVEHQSFWLDVKIIAWTILRVIRMDGIDQPGSIGSAEFMGNHDVESNRSASSMQPAK